MRVITVIASLIISTILAAGSARRHILLKPNEFVAVVGPVTTSLVDHVIQEWASPAVHDRITETKETIFYINSPGGSVHAGNHLIQYMRALQSQNITVGCIAQNFMSMAFIIMQACDHRMVLANSIGMQHQMSFVLRGDIENMRRSFDFHDRINEKMILIELEKIGMCRQEYDDRIAHDWWLYGDENLEENTADELVVFSCSSDLYNQYTIRQDTIGRFTFFIRTHRCPLLKEVTVSDQRFSMMYDSDHYPERVHDILQIVTPS